MAILSVTDPNSGKEIKVDWADSSVEPTDADIQDIINSYNGVSEEKSNSLTDKLLRGLVGTDARVAQKKIMDVASGKMKQGKEILGAAVDSGALWGTNPIIKPVAKGVVSLLPESPQGLAFDIATVGSGEALAPIGKYIAKAFRSAKQPLAQFDTVANTVSKYRSDMYDWFEKKIIGALSTPDRNGKLLSMPAKVVDDLKTKLTEISDYGNEAAELYQKALQKEIDKIPQLKQLLNGDTGGVTANTIKDIYTGIRKKVSDMGNKILLRNSVDDVVVNAFPELQDVRKLYNTKRQAVSTVESLFGKGYVKNPKIVGSEEEASKRLLKLNELAKSTSKVGNEESRAEMIKRVLSPELVSELGGYANTLRLINISKKAAIGTAGVLGVGAVTAGASKILR